jgi:hypothetical protein
MMPAPLAGVGAFSLEPKPVGFLGALWADMALTKPDIKQVFQARFVSRITVKKFLNRYARFFFVRFHYPKHTPNHYLCQGDNSVPLLPRLAACGKFRALPDNCRTASTATGSLIRCVEENDVVARQK